MNVNVDSISSCLRGSKSPAKTSAKNFEMLVKESKMYCLIEKGGGGDGGFFLPFLAFFPLAPGLPGTRAPAGSGPFLNTAGLESGILVLFLNDYCDYKENFCLVSQFGIPIYLGIKTINYWY